MIRDWGMQLQALRWGAQTNGPLRVAGAQPAKPIGCSWGTARQTLCLRLRAFGTQACPLPADDAPHQTPRKV